MTWPERRWGPRSRTSRPSTRGRRTPRRCSPPASRKAARASGAGSRCRRRRSRRPTRRPCRSGSWRSEQATRTRRDREGRLAEHRFQRGQAVAAVGLGCGVGRLLGLAHVVAQLLDEPRRVAGHRFARALAARAVRQRERFSRAGDADVHQAALLLQPAFVDRVAVRQDVLLDADQENVAELQPLGGVQRRQPHRVGLFLLASLEQRDQRDGLRQLQQVLLVLLAFLGDPGGELEHVVPLVLRRALVVLVEQVNLVVDRLQQLVEQLSRRFAHDALLDAVDEVAELGERRQLALADLRRGGRREHRLEQADVEGGGDLAELLQRRRADAALGRRDGADERRIVVAVGDQAQVGDHVLDLGAVEERLPARQLVRHLLVPQRLLEDARLVVAAVEDGVVAPLGAVLELVRQQPHHHRFGLVLVVLGRHHLDRVADAEVAPQPLLEQLGIVGNEAVGGLEDANGRAVVLLQLDHVQVRVVFVELAQVVGRRAAPAVDRLVDVADRGERRAHAGELLQQAVLRDVGVLVFVDQDVAQAVLPLLAQLGVGVEELGRQADQVVEVDRLVGAQGGVVAVVDLGVGARVVVLGGGERGGGRLQFVLPQRDARHRAADLLLVGGLEDFRNDAHRVGGVENRERRLQLGELRVLAQHAQASGERVFTYLFWDENKKEAQYWRDVGTLDAYYEASMDLVQVDPVFNLYDPEWPMRTYQPQLPPAKFVFAEDGRRGVATESVVSMGCIVSGSDVRRSILCPDVRIHSFCEVED